MGSQRMVHAARRRGRVRGMCDSMKDCLAVTLTSLDVCTALAPGRNALGLLYLHVYPYHHTVCPERMTRSALT